MQMWDYLNASLIDSELEFPLYPSGKQKLRRRFGEP